MRRAGLTIALFFISLHHCAAAPFQDWALLRKQAEANLQTQANAAYPQAKAKVTVGPVDSRLSFPACPAPVFELPTSSRIWGRGSVKASCTAPTAWAIYLSFDAQVNGPALTLKSAMMAAATLSPADVSVQPITYEQDPGSYVQDLQQYKNAQLARPLPAGTPLRIDDLKLPTVVRAGQRVRVTIEGAGFVIGQDGIATQSAPPGTRIRVKLGNGRRIEGIVQADGSVKVSP